jgi:hypothetical protein
MEMHGQKNIKNADSNQERQSFGSVNSCGDVILEMADSLYLERK